MSGLTLENIWDTKVNKSGLVSLGTNQLQVDRNNLDPLLGCGRSFLHGGVARVAIVLRMWAKTASVFISA